MSTEELRQNVFSSIHMSTLVKSVQANISYPSCTFCGGTLINSNPKGSPKRKSAICQVSLYTNSSESFIVWFKKQEEPKGMLWMRTCCIRKGADAGNVVELISRSCRGRCSYTLKFSTNAVSEEWHKLLKQESKRIPSFGDELPVEEEGYQASLDYVLTDISPLSVLDEILHGNSEEKEDGETQNSTEPSTTTISPTTSPKLKLKPKHKTVICNPLQGLSAKKSRKSSVIPISSSFNNSTVNPLEDTDYLSRWSWPMKV